MAVPRAVRRLLVITVAGLLVLAVFTTRTRDSTEEVFDGDGRPRLGTAIRFQATAYCKGETTAAGIAVRHGMAAADATLLPLGSVVYVETDDTRYSGIWTVLDTGPEVKGRELDLYMWSCNDALAFGRQPVRVTILRLGWDPRASAPAPVEQLFRRRERAQPPAPSPPPAVTDPAPTPAPVPPPASGVTPPSATPPSDG
ncbi:MAG: 3D domain-containing protein [Acidobacteria bacterium]|nr:3D domain-containing protein [Acidobacteriota bacterium]